MTAPKLPEGLKPVALPRMTPGIYAGELTMFPSDSGKYVRLSDAQAALQAIAAEKDAECETLRAAIRDHNTDCESRCEQRQQDGDAHCPYAKYGRQCPDCPRDGMVDAAIDSAIALAAKEAK